MAFYKHMIIVLIGSKWQRGLETWISLWVLVFVFLMIIKRCKGASMAGYTSHSLFFQKVLLTLYKNMHILSIFLITQKMCFIHRQSNFALLDACNFAWILVSNEISNDIIWFHINIPRRLIPLRPSFDLNMDGCKCVLDRVSWECIS